MKRQYHKFFAVVALAVSSAVLLNQLVFLTGLSESSAGYQDALKVMQSMDPSVLVLMAVFIAPIYEEMIFRGLFYAIPLRLIKRFRGRDAGKKSVPLFVFISSLAFALYHGNLVQFIYAFFMALLMCFTYECCGGLLWTILFHMNANLSALISGFFREYPDRWFTFVALAVLLFTAVVCVRYMIGLKRESEAGGDAELLT